MQLSVLLSIFLLFFFLALLKHAMKLHYDIHKILLRKLRA